MQFAGSYCLDEADEMDLLIALQEALANAALHGCGNDASKSIHCCVNADASTLCFVIRDPGPGFDFERIADPSQFGPSTLEHGRGIPLMRAVVDGVIFAHGGSEIRLCKRLR